MLKQVLESITRHFLRTYDTPYDINNGGCEDWANEVLDAMRTSSHMVGLWATDWDHADSSHIFIEIDQRFYDAERLEGADDYMQLPLFAKWQAEHPGQVEPVQLEDCNDAYDPQGRPSRQGYTAEQLEAVQQRDAQIMGTE